jgi:hypothetical protein
MTDKETAAIVRAIYDLAQHGRLSEESDTYVQETLFGEKEETETTSPKQTSTKTAKR